MNYNYRYNSELKVKLRKCNITYGDIAVKAMYSVQTIKAWMRLKLTTKRTEIINKAMEQIREERRLLYED